MRSTAFAVLIGLVLIVLLTIFSLQTFVAARGNAFDFTPHYIGAQALLAGENPYSNSVTERIQTTMFGGTLYSGMDQQRFSYPAYTALLLVPFTWLPLPLANALWMSLNLAGVLISIVLWLFTLGHKPKPITFFGITMLLVFCFRYPMNTYLIGQFIGLMLLLFSISGYLLIRKQNDVAAGVILAFACNPPTIAAPMALLILAGYALKGRWRGLNAFVVILGTLVLLPMLIVGNWLPHFLNNLDDYAGYAHPIWALGQAPTPVAFLIAIVLLALLWNTWRKRDWQFHYWSLCVIAVLIFIPQTGNYYLSLLIIPLLVGWCS